MEESPGKLGLFLFSAEVTDPVMEVIIVLTVIYERGGCSDIRFFKNKEEFDDWYQRQFAINPDTKIIDVKEEP